MPSTSTRASGPMASAGLAIRRPSTTTRPAAIQASASRREQSPARAMRLAILSRGPPTADAPSARGRDEGIEDLPVAGADRVFRMPLHAQAVAIARILDPLDHAVGRDGIDDDARSDGLHR